MEQIIKFYFKYFVAIIVNFWMKWVSKTNMKKLQIYIYIYIDNMCLYFNKNK